MPLYNADARLAAPTPRHWLTTSAEAARRAVSSFAWRKRHGGNAPLVTVREANVPLAPVTTSARRLVEAAKVAGLEVMLVHGAQTVNAGKSNEAKAPAIQVAAWSIERGVGFRATWVRGKAAIGIWYEAGVTSRAGEACGVAAVIARVGAL